jgi:ABC-type uncharacterized transport system auxiliary subunit
MILFSGCISITKELPSYKTYILNLNTKIPIQQIYKDISIGIYEPKANGLLNTNNIIYSKDKLLLESYSINKWSQKPTKILENMIVKYFSNSGNFKYVASQNIKLHTDYKLISELDSFTQYFEGSNSYVNLSIRAYIIKNQQKVFTKTFKYDKKCSSNDAAGAVKALNDISNKFVKDLHHWVITDIN